MQTLIKLFNLLILKEDMHFFLIHVYLGIVSLSGDGSVEFGFLGSIQNVFLSFLELFKLRFFLVLYDLYIYSLVLTPLIVI